MSHVFFGAKVRARVNSLKPFTSRERLSCNGAIQMKPLKNFHMVLFVLSILQMKFRNFGHLLQWKDKFGLILCYLGPTLLMSPTSVTSERTQQASAMTLAQQQRPMGTTISATEILSKVEVGQMGEKFSSEAVNIAEIAASGGLTEEKRKEITKNLMEKHTLECAQLENELRTNEIKVISEVIQAYEERKSKAVADLQVKLVVTGAVLNHKSVFVLITEKYFGTRVLSHIFTTSVIFN